jgi:predicted enzyme related to lactoylglutathione lyase
MSTSSLTLVRWGIAPDFLVDDVVTTANFYRDKLGFQYDRFWGEPPCFCMVRRNGVIIMLSQSVKPGIMRPNQKAQCSDTWDAYIWVDAVDALYAEFQARGVRIAREICDQPYECRDFDAEDCNGFRLCFGQPIG